MKRHCRICDNQAYLFYEDRRPFYICKKCGLIFSDCPLSIEEIKKHYQSQYVNVFDWNKEAKAILDVVSFAVKPQKIFDFGAGSGFLSNVFRSMGMDVDSYEPMFHGAFKAEQFSKGYDLVVLNEVVEHVEDINTIFDNLYAVTRTGGIIFISTAMTDALINETGNFQELFNNWWYKDDLTHISFFCQLTFEYICSISNKDQMQMLSLGANGVILQKRDKSVDETGSLWK